MKSLEYYFDHYAKAHTHPVNRLCHGLGIPTIIVALILLIFTHHTQWGWILFALGWAFQFIGHAFERTWPEFFHDPLYIVIGPLYLVHKLTKKK